MSGYRGEAPSKFTLALWEKWQARKLETEAVKRRREGIATFRRMLQRPVDAL